MIALRETRQSPPTRASEAMMDMPGCGRYNSVGPGGAGPMALKAYHAYPPGRLIFTLRGGFLEPTRAREPDEGSPSERSQGHDVGTPTDGRSGLRADP